ncbi:hypothetical protein [endosymbiont GvMRE of Glomus versiforme]|uniref:hypothetical protein n=1 Tax=endosymbiont GvMRE of Glomus versiforme TaxID=2039283 RepID=UPI000EE112ED|nr:hypothetical protein [endosymbiont GvMRE of Glomus versiforme]RHZ37793.1 Transposase [endosymbiont GvMRE of Glomus versiforme]
MKKQTKLKKPAQKQLALAFGIDERTIRRWDKLNSFIKLGRKPKIPTRDSVSLRFRILSNRIKTQREAVDYLYQQTGIKVNQSTISRTLKSWHYSQEGRQTIYRARCKKS